MKIRFEKSADVAAIFALNEAAFDTDAEARLVDRLRNDVTPYISLVAESNDQIIGNIVFTPVTLDKYSGGLLLGLAPMAVAPDRQNTGVGSALVDAGLAACREASAVAVVVLGHPAYYPRFGFTPASGFGLACDYDVPDEAFMAIELQPGSLAACSGTLHYHPTFAGV
ncbi:MAG: N-acetyltransferase [Gammaproteobacteria bacterium]|nr:N-acetyltransferase [Gammaproteobacteria bacterium]